MNAAADRLEDSFPHGTPKGYDDGCRGAVCPGADLYGLSCKRAKQLAASDYGYQKLAKRGLTPGEVALELGLIPENPTPVLTAPSKRPAKAELAPNPDPVETAPQPAATPTQSEIRAWARANGIDVNPKGSVRTDVVAAYRSAHDPAQPLAEQSHDPSGNTPAPTDGAAAAPAESTDAEGEDMGHPDHTPATEELIDQIRDRIDMPKPPTTPVDEHTLADATTEPDKGTEISTPGEFAARWNNLTEGERATWISRMRAAHTAAERCFTEDHATLVNLRDTRPEWSTVATTEDLGNAITQRDQARRFAEHCLAELAHLEQREESALTLALQKWAEATAERDTRLREITTLRNTLASVRDVEAQLSAAYAEIRALADVAEERDRLAAQLTMVNALAASQQEEIERQRRVIEAAATARPAVMRDVLRIGGRR